MCVVAVRCNAVVTVAVLSVRGISGSSSVCVVGVRCNSVVTMAVLTVRGVSGSNVRGGRAH